MGHLDSSSERRAYAAHFYRLFGAWRVEWTKSKKAFQIWVWDSLPSPRDAPTAATPMIGNLRAAYLSSATVPQEGRFCADSVSKH